MAAPDGIVWGSVKGSGSTECKIGIYVSVTNDATSPNLKSKRHTEIWFWSKYSVQDSNNTFYYNDGEQSATTNRGSVTINTTVATGSGWSTANQVKLKEYDYTFSKGTSAVTYYVSAKLTGVERPGVSEEMTCTTTYTIPALSKCTISYNLKGGTGTSTSQTKYYGTDITLHGAPTKTGHTFQGWSTADDSTVEYAAGAKYTSNAGNNVTLYAVWKTNTYTVTYDANGGTLGSVTYQTKTYGVALTLTGTATRENYELVGWAISKTSTTTTYKTGDNYTANSATTLYAVWKLVYVKPRITNTSCERYTDLSGDGTQFELDDNGTCAKVIFDYSCDKPVKEIKIAWKATDVDEESITVDSEIGKTNGTVAKYIWTVVLSTDKTYSFRVTVTDEKDYTTEFLTLNGSNIPFDVLMDEEEGPQGISFGKPAELEGKADFGYEIYPRNGIANILLEPETDLNDILTPNTYIGENVSTYNYQNCPITSGTFSLEVVSGGPDGQVIQTLTVTSQTNCTIYQRHYHRVDGEWMWAKDSSGNYIWNCIYSAQGKLLWSGAWHMNATQSSVLSEPISYQPSGIILVFSMYNISTMKKEDYAWNEFFVPKQVVQRHGGKGHSFLMSDATAVIAAKYLYIYDDHIDGYTSTENVNVGNDCVVTANGITYKNSSFVLRYVFGV